MATDTKSAQFYAKARGSKWFVIGLVTFIATWLTCHNLWGIDKDFGMLNLFLSAEASIGMAFFTMLSDKQTTDNHQQTLLMYEMLKAIQDQDSKLFDAVASIQEDLDGL